jgi:hypothetical protein
MDQNLPPIPGRTRARDQSALRQPFHQLARAVMLELDPLGQNSDARLLSRLNNTLDREQQLMLLRLDPGGARRLFAKVEKPPDLVAELRQSSVIGFCNRFQ